MPAILLRFEAPMQSWGISSKFTDRQSETEPTKSGIIGIIASALGIPRDGDIATELKLESLNVAVRVDREGDMVYDYHTTQNVMIASKKKYTNESSGKTVVSRRFFLSDACFIIGIESPDEQLLQKIQNALLSPKWPLYLGRKAFIPSSRINLLSKPIDEPLLDVLEKFPWQGRDGVDKIPKSLRILTEGTPKEGSPRLTNPISFSQKEYSVRYVKTSWLNTDEIPEVDI
jgi:CRISPR system Cascade subunit CasD